MYTVTVRDHVMVAHSLRGAVFGPAQRLHGATYVVEARFARRELDADGLVVDIGLATQALRSVLEDLAYRNLDELPELAGRNTTTEFLARVVFDRLAARVLGGDLGAAASAPKAPHDPQGLARLRVTLRESPVAWAAYEGELR
ncbi:MAG: 6-carboxytetrahydropterin synthase [Rubrivivax sp.]|nr:6-carboxytetrahydropterin synthase [Rubrivivax sp.]